MCDLGQTVYPEKFGGDPKRERKGVLNIDDNKKKDRARAGIIAQKPAEAARWTLRSGHPGQTASVYTLFLSPPIDCALCVSSIYSCVGVIILQWDSVERWGSHGLRLTASFQERVLCRTDQLPPRAGLCKLLFSF